MTDAACVPELAQSRPRPRGQRDLHGRQAGGQCAGDVGPAVHRADAVPSPACRERPVPAQFSACTCRRTSHGFRRDRAHTGDRRFPCAAPQSGPDKAVDGQAAVPLRPYASGPPPPVHRTGSPRRTPVGRHSRTGCPSRQGPFEPTACRTVSNAPHPRSDNSGNRRADVTAARATALTLLGHQIAVLQ